MKPFFWYYVSLISTIKFIRCIVVSLWNGVAQLQQDIMVINYVSLHNIHSHYDKRGQAKELFAIQVLYRSCNSTHCSNSSIKFPKYRSPQQIKRSIYNRFSFGLLQATHRPKSKELIVKDYTHVVVLSHEEITCKQQEVSFPLYFFPTKFSIELMSQFLSFYLHDWISRCCWSCHI